MKHFLPLSRRNRGPVLPGSRNAPPAVSPPSRRAGFDLAAVLERKPESDWQLNTHVSLRNRYVFFQVCKAAGSTVTHHLQAVEYEGTQFRVQDPKNKYLSPHLSPYQFEPTHLAAIMQDPTWRRVAFVRNPFTRLLSCYLHRIVAEPQSPSARWYRKSSGDTDTPTFARFVEVVCRQPSVEMERHWRVQSDEVLADVVRLDFVGRFERLREDLERLSQFLFGRDAFDAKALAEVNASPMRTGAESRLYEYYTPELVTLVVRRFHRDFELFDYPTSLPR
jgi:Sulfotransferase family